MALAFLLELGQNHPLSIKSYSHRGRTSINTKYALDLNDEDVDFLVNMNGSLRPLYSHCRTTTFYLSPNDYKSYRRVTDEWIFVDVKHIIICYLSEDYQRFSCSEVLIILDFESITPGPNLGKILFQLLVFLCDFLVLLVLDSHLTGLQDMSL